MTTPVTTQGPATQGMPTQQRGYMQGFPPPFGLEQYLGQSQQYGGFPQQHGGYPQQSHTQWQFPGQHQLTGQQFPIQPQQVQQPQQIQQIVQSLVSQLLPIAQQVILPQVVGTAAQQIPMYLQQLVTQQVTWQLGQQLGQQGGHQFGQPGGWQQPNFGQPGWQQPQFTQQGQFGQSYPGSF